MHNKNGPLTNERPFVVAVLAGRSCPPRAVVPQTAQITAAIVGERFFADRARRLSTHARHSAGLGEPQEPNQSGLYLAFVCPPLRQ
jgi:hypothetical protein